MEMEAVTGAVVTEAGILPIVITKFNRLLKEYKLQKGVEEEIMFLQAELESMKAALEKLSVAPESQLDKQHKIWARDVRELTYDIEDSIDTFMVRGEGNEHAIDFKKYIDRSADLLTQLGFRHNIASDIVRDIQSRVREMHGRHLKYDVNLGVDNPFKCTVDLDPPLSNRYTMTKDLVGIDERRDELIKILMDETWVPMQNGKTISIVGPGGLGKTTLANAVYEKIRALFDCYAFVSVSRTPDLNKLFKSLLGDLDCKKIDEEIFTQGQLINVLREFLQDKRYCIVIDDIWDISVWNTIKCALPDNDVGYIVITTTRSSHVAEIAGGAYQMKPLSLNNSRKLLYRRIFGNEKQDAEDTEKCPSQELAELCNTIIEKCAGLPSAISVIGSLLASKARNKMEWYNVYNSIGTSLENSTNVVAMRNSFSLGYYDEPYHLKACLCLSVFLKDHKIKRNRLIRSWIAEEYVQCKKPESIGKLQKLVFRDCLPRLDIWGCWFSTLPAWISSSLLPNLSSLSISIRNMKQADLEILGRLPSLHYLKLIVDHESLGINEKFVVGSCLFPCLVQCQLFGFKIPVMFQQGAMPRLASIKMEFPVQNMRENTDIGLGNLPSTQDITILFNCRDTNEGDLEEVKAVLRHAIETHPNQPSLRIVINCKRNAKSHVKKVHDYSYKIDGVVAGPITATVFPCLFTQYMKVADHVDNEEAVNELMKILREGTEMPQAQGKVVSIVGLGGLGKTTLAHSIYRKLRAQFDCWASVSMSRNPDMKKLFKCMLYQLGKKNNANIHEGILDERQLIYELNEFLQKRRYFIVIDDIRDILVWNMIKCALPTNDGGFIIIITTCILDVAKQVGGTTYMMRPLSLQNSRILLHKKTFGIEDKDEYADEDLTEISEKVLQKCGGVSLAIIMISGLLTSKGENKKEWYKVYNSIDTVVKNSQDVENTKKILSVSYGDLPSHLRTCLLYLSVFPEGHDIDKDRLIRLWIAEGLIQCGKQESPYELGESYFYELINRSMIQPVYKRWYYDMTECCHVHDMVLDLICYLSGKEKLVSIWDHMHETFDLKEVQWLSLQNSMVDYATLGATMNMQEVRSVVVFPSAVKLLPDLACFKVLRVLDLQSCCLSQGCRMKYLGNLVHLRYLGLRETGITHLSEEVGKLQCLQTLDVRRNKISSLPSTVVDLKHLMCLHIDSRTKLANGIGSFTSLEEVSTLRIQDSTDVIEELGNLTELRVLGIDCHTVWNINGVEKALVECLHKLHKIKTLSISMVGECNLDAWVAPQHLRRLELTGCWPSTVPALLNNPSRLLELSFLSIEVRKLRQEDLQKLGRLPALSYLDIEVGNQNLGILPRRFDIGARSFPCLVHCTLRGYMGPVVFEQGAMPELARLHLAFPVREARLAREAADINGSFDLGFVKLPRLQDVSFLLQRGGASKGEVEEAEAALRRAIESHPNHPTLQIF